MYRFLEGTADQYMTRPVATVTRETTMRELEASFEKHDFNSFPVVEDGKMLESSQKFAFLRAFAFTTGQMVPHCDDRLRKQVSQRHSQGRAIPLAERYVALARKRHRRKHTEFATAITCRASSSMPKVATPRPSPSTCGAYEDGRATVLASTE
jgi:CBS domain-containing protein